jgi:hypothetical protein
MDPAIRLVLDTSAILAFANGSIDVGETIAEAVDGGGGFGVPVPCLVEACRREPKILLDMVPLLIQHPSCTVLPVLSEDWNVLAGLTTALGRFDLATALVEAHDREGYVVTGEADLYRPAEGDDDLSIIEI